MVDKGKETLASENTAMFVIVYSAFLSVTPFKTEMFILFEKGRLVPSGNLETWNAEESNSQAHAS